MRRTYPLLSGFLLIASAAFPSLSPGAEPGGTVGWQELKTLYDAGNYEEALRLLQREPNQGHAHYYNLGTVAYRLNRHGQAVAYLEMARQLKPGDSDTRQNLELARTALSQLLGPSKLDPASTSLESFGDLMAQLPARAALATVGLFCMLIGAIRYARSRTLRGLLLHPAGAIAALGVVLELAIVAGLRVHHDHPAAFALERQVVRSGPGEKFFELAQVEAGVKLRRLATSTTDGTWYQVRYSDDRVGWLRAEGLLTP
ncbi:MAG: hypothetical protein NDJ90_07885 [Oligoflexia bacterium]|nr:hypothetical protein [Oligoflexia bacterium]